MASTLEFNNKLNIIEIVFTERVSAVDLATITTKSIALVNEKSIFNVLIDAKELKLDATLVDIYNLPDKQYVDENLDHRIRMALIEPKLSKEKEAAQFYENACVNRGWLVKTFSDRDDATKWLMSRVASKKSFNPDGANNAPPG
jgi:hypothetical protein